MISDRIVQLCKDVERLACELDRLTARGHSRTVYAVLMRMKLAAMTAELVTADLVERLQQAPVVAKADSEAARAPR
jgi:crotonobetainyl-CoA:carnitine CoA-transferase CaiB-like acyl-CoA transferase